MPPFAPHTFLFLKLDGAMITPPSHACMTGLYNKAAQDIVTRGMVVPPQVRVRVRFLERIHTCGTLA